jgi:hypothetical protein
MTPIRLTSMITEHSGPYMTRMFRDHGIHTAGGGSVMRVGRAVPVGQAPREGGRDA